MSRIIYALVEGDLDATVARRVIAHAGGVTGTVYGKKGVNYIKNRIDSFNESARGIPILTLVDLMDTDFGCPVEARDAWLPNRNEGMILRFVVREIESWLLADRSGMARFLRIRRSAVSYHPENLVDPKRTLVELARTSHSASLRKDLVPNDPSQNAQGKGYTSRVQDFVRKTWDIEAAAENAGSLRRCIRSVRDIVRET
jgi:hypothetical protein